MVTGRYDQGLWGHSRMTTRPGLRCLGKPAWLIGNGGGADTMTYGPSGPSIDSIKCSIEGSINFGSNLTQLLKRLLATLIANPGIFHPGHNSKVMAVLLSS